MTEKLEEDEEWILVENLIESYYSLDEMDHPNAEKVADLLDKLSPNWRDAETDDEVEINEVVVQ